MLHNLTWLVLSSKRSKVNSKIYETTKCAFGSKLKGQFILLFSLFFLLFIRPLYFLVLFMGHTVLFQLTFTFIYSTFSKKFSVSSFNKISGSQIIWLAYFSPTYFTIQLIFTTIHWSHCTFWYYSWVPQYYFN